MLPRGVGGRVYSDIGKMLVSGHGSTGGSTFGTPGYICVIHMAPCKLYEGVSISADAGVNERSGYTHIHLDTLVDLYGLKLHWYTFIQTGVMCKIIFWPWLF